MKKTIWFLLLLPLSLSAQTEWNTLNDKALVKFKIKNFGIWVNGTFDDFEGKIRFDPQQPETARIQGRVSVQSINTGIQKRDEHLKSADYFDAARYPYIEIASKQIEKKDASTYLMNSTITMHGIRKSLTLSFIFLESEGRGIFTSSFQVLRSDFGIGSSGGLLGDEVKIALSIPVTR